MATVVRQADAMQKIVLERRAAGRMVAVVPTMGALHDGHLALIRKACERADTVIVTIFVNPLQFAPTEDLEKYPRPFEKDVTLAGEAGAEFVFAPSAEEMYPRGFQTNVIVERVTKVLEGASRPTHFRGVTTVVAKLFNITLPHVAVFGQKDGQQAVVVRRMLRDLNVPVELVVVPTVREADGLAKSSRNVYLTAEQRSQAPVLYQSLQLAERMIRDGERSCDVLLHRMRNAITEHSVGTIEYVSIADAETLEEMSMLDDGQKVMISLAVRFGTTRLIDNLPVDIRTENRTHT